MRAVYPLVFALLSSISSVASAQDPVPQHTIHIDTEGRYTVDGLAISRDALRLLIRDNPDTLWAISAAPSTPSLHILSVEDMLRRSGARFTSAAAAPPPEPSSAPPPEPSSVPPPEPSSAPPPEPSSAPPPLPTSSFPTLTEPQPLPGVSVPMPVQGPQWVQPLADVRAGLQGDNLADADGPAQAAFGFTRAAVGARAEVSPWFQGQVLVNVVQQQAETALQTVTLSDGTEATVELPLSVGGYGVHMRDLWADIRLDEGSRFQARVGVQPPIFGVQPWLNDDAGGFYTDAVRFQTVSILAGLDQERAMGASISAKLTDGVTLSGMASNNDNFLVPEDNTGKDLSGRLEVQQGSVTGVFSARYAPRGAENVGSTTSISAAARVDTAAVRLMVEGLYGTTDSTRSDTVAAVPFGGVQAAGALEIAAAPEMLEAYRLVGRFGFFDPRLETDDADAWMQFNGGARVALAPQLSGAQAQVGAGYEVDVPINLELAVVHRALLEVLWRY